MAREKTVHHMDRAPRRVRMRGPYHANRGGGPRGIYLSGVGEAASARLFICAECRAQALICSCCDRGQIYCAGDCGPLAGRRDRRAGHALFGADSINWLKTTITYIVPYCVRS
jgi:hypothetical protein